MIKYRVVLKVGYNEAWFEFDEMEKACVFATEALTHMIDNEDGKRRTYINMQVVDTSQQKDEDEE